MAAVGGEDGIVGRLRAAGCVFAEDETALLVERFARGAALDAAVRRRTAGEPLEQVLGWAEFAGLRIGVLPGVFVPRLRTSAILTAVEELLDGGGLDLPSGALVVDLCCGTGALGAALRGRLPGVRILAADIDPVAVECARANLPGASVFAGDLFEALPGETRGSLALVVVNAPYVPTDEIANMPSEARDHEHRVALDGGTDGLDLHRRIARDAVEWVRPAGVLLLETSRAQAESTRSFFAAAEWTTTLVLDDDVDGTVLVARRAG